MKLLVADDHQLVRDGLHHLLEQQDNNTVVLEAANYHDCLAILCAHPDITLILMDFGLPDQDGFEAIHNLRMLYPTIPLVVISAHENREFIQQVLLDGSMGFIPKSSGNEEILKAIQFVLSGGIYIPPHIFANPTTNPKLVYEADKIRPGNILCTPATSRFHITKRQEEVLSLLMQGKSNKVICRELNLALGTVKIHVREILRELGASSRAEAISIASKNGFTFS